MNRFVGIMMVALGAASSAYAEDTLGKIKASGKVVMGVRESSAPLSYTLGNGKFVGYHVEICEKIIQNARKQLGIANVQIEYSPVTSQNRIPLVQNGTVDIECGSTTNNSARQQQVAFALTTYVTEVRMAVGTKSGISSIEQLNGKTVVTTTGTTSVQTLRKNERAKGIDFKEIYGKDHADSFLNLASGRADAFVMDDSILAGNISTAKNPADFKIVGEVLSVEPIAIMFRKDDPTFKKLADDTIREMAKSGELAKLYNKWFMSPIPPKNTSINLPMNGSLKALVSSPNDKPLESYGTK